LNPGIKISSVEAAARATAGIKEMEVTAGNPARGDSKLKYGFLLKTPDPGEMEKGVASTMPDAESMATVRLELFASIPSSGSKTGKESNPIDT